MAPIPRLLIGLLVGFLGAFTTARLLDVLSEDVEAERRPAVLGSPDFERYCRDIGLVAVEVGEAGDRWRCVGAIDGFWAVAAATAEDVCRDQFTASTAVIALAGRIGWQCVASP